MPKEKTEGAAPPADAAPAPGADSEASATAAEASTAAAGAPAPEPGEPDEAAAVARVEALSAEAQARRADLARSGYRLPESFFQASAADRPTSAPNPLAGVQFASEEAARLAAELGLAAVSFADRDPSGQGGYTVADVRALKAE